MYAIVPFYNDTPEILLKAFDSLNFFDFKIIVADGPYREFPNTGDMSTDGCRQLAHQYCADFINSPQGGWPDQVSKRNALLAAVPAREWVLVMDADEELLKFNPEMIKGDQHSVAIAINRGHDYQHAVRVFRKVGKIYYADTHSHLFRGDQLLNNEPFLEQALIWHNDYLRPTERVAAKRVYYAERAERLFDRAETGAETPEQSLFGLKKWL